MKHSRNVAAVIASAAANAISQPLIGVAIAIAAAATGVTTAATTNTTTTTDGEFELVCPYDYVFHDAFNRTVAPSGRRLWKKKTRRHREQLQLQTPSLPQLPPPISIVRQKPNASWVEFVVHNDSPFYDDVVIASDIADFELNLFDIQKANLGGAFSEFVHSARLDNLASCFLAVQALVEHVNDGCLDDDDCAHDFVCGDHYYCE